MAERLTKEELFGKVVGAIRDSGWGLLYLSNPSEHPLRLQVYRGTGTYRVRIYIWNLTHGGGRRRPTGEYRIQITGVDQIEPELGGTTLILGWWSVESVFAAFDYHKHSGPLGASPSFQIAETALHQAAEHGFAPYNKGNKEIAIAVRPD